MAAPSWRFHLVDKIDMFERIAAGEVAPKVPPKCSAPSTEVPPSEQTPSSPPPIGKKTACGKRKDSSVPHTSSKKSKGGLPHSQQIVISNTLSSSQKGKNTQEEVPLLLSGPPLSDQLGKPTLNLTGAECAAVVRSVSSDEDMSSLKNQSPSSLMSVISENLMQGSLVALELSCRAEKCEVYRGSLHDSNKSLKKIESENAALIKQLSLQKKQAEEKIQSLTRDLQEAEHKGLLAVMSGCREQILLTPVGQQYLYLLKEELIKELCRTPHFLDAMGDAIYTLLEAGRKFSLEKLSVKDPTPKEDLKELVMKAPDLNKILGIDQSIPWEGSWWLDTFKRAFEVFI